MEIKTTSGETVYLDDDTLPEILDHNWYWNGKAVFRHVYRGGRQVKVRLHRVIMGAQSGQLVDHIDHNALNNRRKNLRLCTNTQNSRNHGKKAAATSRYIGVFWNKGRNKWYAHIRCERKFYHLGAFDNEADAACAYNEAALRLFGEFANLNKIGI